IKLEMPTINLDGEVSVLATVPEVVEALESCAMTWQKLISRALEEQLKKVPQGDGPLAEVEFWCERSDALSALTEQTKLPEVQKVLEVLQEAESEYIRGLQVVLSDLKKHHVEALDNARFLSTLEHHLKNLTYGPGLTVVLDTIPSLMSALRMVWVISRHYSTDEWMMPLMERIAWVISARVHKAVDLHTLFKEDRTAAKKKVAEAKSTLEQWKKCYLAVCAQIEASGREQHWEFDRKRLFGKTDYMASVCQDLYDILQVVTEEFYNIFGPELKTVTGHPKRVDDLLRGVNGLTSHIEELTFDPFSIKSARDWKSILEEFRAEVSVENIKQIFIQNLKDPPLYKNHPPVAGAIYWCHSLFCRIKHTVTRFQEVEELLASERGKEVKQIYLQVARRMREYENQKYHQWREETEQILPLVLKNTLLTVSSVTEEPLTTKKSVHFTVNFSPTLREIIIETKYMEKLGFPVPETARYVALQEDKYLRYTRRLKKLLDRYHKLMGTLNKAETTLLDDHIQELWSIFRLGHRSLNWNSSGSVGDFIMQCTQAIGKLELLVYQVHRHSEDINKKLLSIESTNLFKFLPSKSGDELPKAKEFFEYVKYERAKDVAHMVGKYSAIPQVLRKVEGRVANTNSGKSPKLASYYAYWENRIYQVLTQLIVKNLQAFNAAVLANVPLFQIEAILPASEIILQPDASEIEKLTTQCIRDCIEVTKHFVRWLHGTCIECPPQLVKEGEVLTFSFYSDVSQNSLIIEQAVLITQNVHKALASLSKYLNHWQRYHQLWKLDKGVAMERLAAEKPSCVTFDEKLQFYRKVAQEVTQQPLIKDEQCLRLQLAPLAYTLQENARAWKMSLGKLLNESAREELFSLQEEIQVGVFSL
ncbi:DYH10 protein, partial [Brachypteracias leptosomus]|nr:DYH10 protein [Brachypteracias leptosomus]